MKKITIMKILKVFGFVFLFAASGAVGVGAGVVQHSAEKIQKPSVDEFNEDNIMVNQAVAEDEETTEMYTDIAIFGVDARNHSLGKGNRSDSIMVATINNETHDVVLTSFYRDTLVDIPGKGYDKLTHAYSYGGPELAINTLNHNFDMAIKDYVTVNFAIAEDIIDMMGGVEIEISNSEVNSINKFMVELYNEGADTDVEYLDESGMVTLTGSQAVAYARTRNLKGGDYKRAKRQRTVIDAAIKKAKKTDFATITQIINESISNVNTSLSMDEILGLAKNVFDYNVIDSQGFPYHVKNAKTNTYAFPTQRTFVEISKCLADDVKNLHYMLYGVGTPVMVDVNSDSEMDEDNGKANKLYGTDTPTSLETDAKTVDESKKDYEPSETVKGISEELASRVY
ncbi:MAG: LCP family protein [Lachnospiraceae bacterium]|nr:LCP family protein [Lachnospiraceae bacterium]